MYNDLLELIKTSKRIIIHRHNKPDGDALGSQIGLKEIIKENYPNVDVYAVGDESNRYKFIGDMDVIEDQLYEGALVIILDSSELYLVSDERYKMGRKLVKIDHHIKRESFGDLEIIDETFESCCGLVTDIAINLNLKITQKAAAALYTGLVTDSGRFRYDSTTSKTFYIASKLLETGIDINNIYNNLYLDDLSLVQLRAKYVLKMQLTKKNVAYIKTTAHEIKEMNFDLFTISRGMVNTMAGIKGVDIWVNFTEDITNNNVICEIRSSKYNINGIAVKYGGGGHAKASGATLENFETAEKLLDDLDNLIEEV